MLSNPGPSLRLLSAHLIRLLLAAAALGLGGLAPAPAFAQGECVYAGSCPPGLSGGGAGSQCLLQRPELPGVCLWAGGTVSFLTEYPALAPGGVCVAPCPITFRAAVSHPAGPPSAHWRVMATPTPRTGAGPASVAEADGPSIGYTANQPAHLSGEVSFTASDGSSISSAGRVWVIDPSDVPAPIEIVGPSRLVPGKTVFAIDTPKPNIEVRIFYLRLPKQTGKKRPLPVTPVPARCKRSLSVTHCFKLPSGKRIPYSTQLTFDVRAWSLDPEAADSGGGRRFTIVSAKKRECHRRTKKRRGAVRSLRKARKSRACPKRRRSGRSSR